MNKTINLKAVLELIKADSGNRPEPNSTMTQFALAMKRKGLKEIGAGAMALVFQSEKTDEVVKVFRRDECFVKYLTLIANNPGNPHFPKIHQYENLQTPPYRGLHIVKMEKLDPINDNTELKILGIIKDLVEELHLIEETPPEQVKPEYTALVEQLKSSLAKVVNDNANPNKSIFNAVELIGKGITGVQCSPDLHRHNIMKRKDGTYVIIDPYI